MVLTVFLLAVYRVLCYSAVHCTIILAQFFCHQKK